MRLTVLEAHINHTCANLGTKQMVGRLLRWKDSGVARKCPVCKASELRFTPSGILCANNDCKFTFGTLLDLIAFAYRGDYVEASKWVDFVFGWNVPLSDLEETARRAQRRRKLTKDLIALRDAGKDNLLRTVVENFARKSGITTSEDFLGAFICEWLGVRQIIEDAGVTRKLPKWGEGDMVLLKVWFSDYVTPARLVVTHPQRPIPPLIIELGEAPVKFYGIKPTLCAEERWCLTSDSQTFWKYQARVSNLLSISVVGRPDNQTCLPDKVDVLVRRDDVSPKICNMLACIASLEHTYVYVINDAHVDGMQRVPWTTYFRRVILEDVQQHKSVPYHIERMVKMLKPSRNFITEVAAELDALGYTLEADYLLRCIDDKRLFSDGKTDLFATAEGMAVWNDEDADPILITNFVIVPISVLSTPDGNTFYKFAFNFKLHAGEFFVPHARLGSLSEMEANVRKASAQVADAAPHVFDQKTATILSRYFKWQAPKLPVLRGVEKLGWSPRRDAFSLPWAYVSEHGAQPTLLVPNDSLPITKHLAPLSSPLYSRVLNVEVNQLELTTVACSVGAMLGAYLRQSPCLIKLRFSEDQLLTAWQCVFGQRSQVPSLRNMTGFSGLPMVCRIQKVPLDLMGWFIAGVGEGTQDRINNAQWIRAAVTEATQFVLHTKLDKKAVETVYHIDAAFRTAKLGTQVMQMLSDYDGYDWGSILNNPYEVLEEFFKRFAKDMQRIEYRIATNQYYFPLDGDDDVELLLEQVQQATETRARTSADFLVIDATAAKAILEDLFGASSGVSVVFNEDDIAKND